MEVATRSEELPIDYKPKNRFQGTEADSVLLAVSLILEIGRTETRPVTPARSVWPDIS